jgi:hypothetical protein
MGKQSAEGIAEPGRHARVVLNSCEFVRIDIEGDARPGMAHLARYRHYVCSMPHEVRSERMEAEIPEPRMPASVAEVEALSWSEMKFIFAISYAQAIRAFVDHGEGALLSELERWEPEARATVARALADVA